MTDAPPAPHPALPPIVSDLLWATTVVVTSPITIDDPTPSWPSIAALAVHVPAAACMMVRRYQPLAALGGAVVLCWAAAMADVFSPGVILAAAVTVYTVSYTSTRPRRDLLIASLVVAALLTWASMLTLPFGLQVPAIISAAGAMGDASRSRREYLRAMTERALRAERTKDAEARRRVAEDRLAIARDLHDAVAHQIAVINLHASVATSALRERPNAAERSLATIRSAARTVLSEIGSLLSSLRDPDAVPTSGLGLDHLNTVVRGFENTGLDITVRTKGLPRPLPSRTDTTALQIIREALTNAHKHGAGRRVHILIEYQATDLRVVVTNPIAAEHMRGAPAEQGHGRSGMRERVEVANGSIVDGPVPPNSWQVTMVLPTAQPVGQPDVPRTPVPGKEVV